MASKLRIGAVSYLNTKPLVRDLDKLLPDAELRYDHPSRLADALAAGSLDIALVPSIELAAHPAWRVVSDACIGCLGPVLSVKLLFRVPPNEVRTLALDEGSRTSAVLAQILLNSLYDLRPALRRLPLEAGPDEEDADAVLMIGDRAIRVDDREYVDVWDLGDRWCRWAELPFVFAMWVARAGVDTQRASDALRAARDAGCEHLREIAQEQSLEMDLPVELVEEYLCHNLHFHLGPQQRRGLELFYRRAADLQLIEQPPRIEFEDCPIESL